MFIFFHAFLYTQLLTSSSPCPAANRRAASVPPMSNRSGGASMMPQGQSVAPSGDDFENDKDGLQSLASVLASTAEDVRLPPIDGKVHV